MVYFPAPVPPSAHQTRDPMPHAHDHHGPDHHLHDHDGHAHGGHGHAHAPASFDRAFAVGVGLNVAFVLAEFLFGIRAHSLALVSDAGHNLSDVVEQLLAFLWVV